MTQQQAEQQQQHLISSAATRSEQQHEQHQEQRRRKKDNNNNEYMWSTIGLCGSVLSMFYFVMNVFPYSGFMALHLLNKNIDNDNNDIDNPTYYTAATIGPHAGVIASAFQIGRVPSAILWGKCADVYGVLAVYCLDCRRVTIWQ